MVDVTIRGAGIFGLSIAWACTERGASVQIVDPNGVGAGSSGGVVGALAPHVPENWNPKKAFQFESLLMAETFWAQVSDVSGLNSGYVRAGRLQPVADDAALALAELRALGARELWQGHATWEVIPAHEGWAPISPSGFMIRDTLSAHLHPAQACHALAEALRRRGCAILQSAEGEGQTIWATGAAGLADLSKTLGHVVGAPIKGQAATFACNMSGAPQLFADGLHVVPHLDGTVAVGSTTEREFAQPTETDGLLEDVIQRARHSVPALREAKVLQRWAGLRPRAKSRAPMLGPWPGRPGHYIANGGFKIGFGMAPGIARVMADLVLDGHDTIPQGFHVTDNLPKGQT